MKRNLRSLFVLVMAVLLIGTAFSSTALAYSVSEASGYIRAKEPVNVRSGPGTGYDRLGWINTGAVLRRTGVSGSWTQVDTGNGIMGYVSSKYVSTASVNAGEKYPGLTTMAGATLVTTVTATSQGTAPSGSASGSYYYATTELNVRTGPGTKYDRLGWLEKGEVVKVVSISSNWAKIVWNGRECYASAKYLAPYGGSIGGSGSSGGVPATSSTGFYAILQSTTVFAGPGASYKVIGMMRRGDIVYKNASYGDWSCINFGKTVGFVHNAYLGYTSSTIATPITADRMSDYYYYGYSTGDTVNAEAIRDYIRYNLNSVNGTILTYRLDELTEFYTLRVPDSYVMTDFAFNGSVYLESNYVSTLRDYTITYRWYRSTPAYTLLSSLANGWDSFKASDKQTYYYKNSYSAATIRLYWIEDGYLHYAEVPGVFDQEDIDLYCHSSWQSVR